MTIDPRVGVLLASLLFAFVTTPLVVGVLRWRRVVDVPNARSSHVAVTVRGAGWSVLFGVLAGWFSADLAGPTLWWLPLGAVAYGLIGFIDDVRSLPVVVRFGLQLLVASSSMAGAELAGVLDVPLIALPLAVVLIVAYVNAFNFMDGINAISGLQAAIAGVALAVAGRWEGDFDVQVGGLAISGAALGFLPFNAIRARCFLGDVGSYFIGAWVAMLAILAHDRGVGFVAIGAVFAVYGADTAWTLLSRVRGKQQWWMSHREHVYQRLTDQGLGHLSVAAIVSAFTASCSGLGLVAVRSGPVGRAVVVCAVSLLVGIYISLPKLLASSRTGQGEAERIRRLHREHHVEERPDDAE